MKKLLLITSVFFLATTIGFATKPKATRHAVRPAKEQLNVKDAEEIAFKAEKVIKEFNGLLNTIQSVDIDSKEMQDVITNSYGGQVNKIFFDKNVVLEDDVNPKNADYQNVQDITIDKYLNNFDLLYTKSKEDETVFFNNIYASNVKKSAYYYIKIFFNSELKGKNSSILNPYKKTRRVAEVRADKVGNKWVAQIARIGFFSPADSLNESKNDVELVEAPAEATKGKGGIQLSAKELARQEQVEAYKKERGEYDGMVSLADSAFKVHDYEKAIEYYGKADLINPYEIYPKAQLFRIKKDLELGKFNEEEILKDYQRNGELAEKRRQYEAAKEFYLKVFEKKPDDKDIENKIKSLDQRIRITVELDEKYNMGDYKDAIKGYDKAIKSNKDNSDLYVGRGKCYVKMGEKEKEKALKDFAKAIELDNTNLVALGNRADLYAENKEYVKAISDYTIYLSIDKNDADVYAARASLRASANNLRQAYEDYDKAIALEPKNADFYYAKGLLLLNNNEADKAIKLFTKAIDLKDDFGEAYYERGLAELTPKINKIQDAGKDFAEARKNGVDDEVVASIVNLASNYYNEGLQRVEGKNIAGAITSFTNAVILREEFTEAYYERGDCYYQQENHLLAINDFNKAIKYNKFYSDAYYRRGLSHFSLKNYALAVPDFDFTYQVTPDFYPALLMKGNSLIQLGKFGQAMEAFQRATGLPSVQKAKAPDPEISSVWSGLGRCQIEMRQFKDADNSLETALKFDKQNAEIYFFRGLAFNALTKYSDAISEFSKAITLSPNDYDIYFERGKTYQVAKKYKESINDFTRVVEADRTTDLALNAFYMRGVSFAKTEQYAQALDDYRQVEQKKIEKLLNIDFYRELGFLNLNVNNPQSSNKYFEKVLELNNNSGEAMYGIACGYVLQNNQIEALKWFEKAFKTRSIAWDNIKKDSYIKEFKNNADFKELVNKLLK
jgi:tetratricopeptide (TPR) repeat protein